jgi:hypothetical protein
MATRKRIGEVLVEAGLIDELQLKSALSHQRQWGGRLGRILVDNRFLSEEQIVAALSHHLRVPRCELANREIPARLLGEIPMGMAEKYNCVPVGMKDGVLHVAMSDPTSFEGIDAIQFKTGKRVYVMIATDSEVERAVRRAYYGEQPRAISGSALEYVQFGGQELAPDEIPVVTGAMLVDDVPGAAPPPGTNDWFLSQGGAGAAAPSAPPPGYTKASEVAPGGPSADLMFDAPNSFLGAHEVQGVGQASAVHGAPNEPQAPEAATTAPAPQPPAEAAPPDHQEPTMPPVHKLDELELLGGLKVDFSDEGSPIELTSASDFVVAAAADGERHRGLELDFSEEGAAIELASASELVTNQPLEGDLREAMTLSLSSSDELGDGEMLELATNSEMAVNPAAFGGVRDPAAVSIEDCSELKDLAHAIFYGLADPPGEAPPAPLDIAAAAPHEEAAPPPRPLPPPAALPPGNDEPEEPPPIEVVCVPPNREPLALGGKPPPKNEPEDTGFGDEPLPGDAGNDLFFGLDASREEEPPPPAAPPLDVENILSLESALMRGVRSPAAAVDAPATLARTGGAASQPSPPALFNSRASHADAPTLLATGRPPAAPGASSRAAAVDDPIALAQRADGGPFAVRAEGDKATPAASAGFAPTATTGGSGGSRA